MKRYVVPFIDQGVVAFYNLVLHLALIRLATPADYGTFVLWHALLMVMVSFQDALVGMPLSLRVAYSVHNRRRFVVERQVAAFGGLFVAAGACVALTAALLVEGRGDPLLVPAVALFATTFLAYYGIRFLAQSRAAFTVALLIDSVYGALVLGGLLALYLATGGVALGPLFFVLAVPGVVASVVGYAALERAPKPRTRKILARYAAIWRDSRWTVAAVAAAELQNRASFFIIAALHGTAALASVFAGLLVLRHLAILTMAWTAFARPFLVSLRDRGAIADVVRFISGSGAALVGLYGLNLAALALAWPLVDAFVFSGKYEDMFTVVVFWTIASCFQVLVAVLAAMLVAYGRYREDSTAMMIGAGVTFILVTALALTLGPRVAIFGIVAGYAVSTVIMYVRAHAIVASQRRWRGRAYAADNAGDPMGSGMPVPLR